MLLRAKGVKIRNRYICSHWVAEILEKSNVYQFEKKNSYDVRPFDYYDAFRTDIIYEGLTTEYLQYIN